MLVSPMGRRRRRPARERRFTPRPVPTAPREAEADAPRPVARETIRPRLGRPSSGQTIGQPSQALLKAADIEQGYVRKDLRRIGGVAAMMLVLLVIASVAANVVLK